MDAPMLPYESVAGAFPDLQLDRLLGGEEDIFAPIVSIFGDSQKFVPCATLDTCHCICAACEDSFPGSYQLSATCGIFDSSEICDDSIDPYYSDASSDSEVDRPSGSQPSGESLLHNEGMPSSDQLSTPIFHDNSQPSPGSSLAQDEWWPILRPSKQATTDESFGKWGDNDTEQAASNSLQQLSPGALEETASHNPEEVSRDSSDEVFDHHQDKLQPSSMSSLVEAESSHGDPPRCAEAPCQAEDGISQPTPDKSLPQEEGNDSAGSRTASSPSSHPLELPKQPAGVGDLKREDDDVVYLGSQPISVCRVPDDDLIFISSWKRPAPLEEDGIAKRRKLGTCLAVIQTVSMPGVSYKWDRHNYLWRPSESTANGGEVAKRGIELAQENITSGRVEIRPNGYEMPIWLGWTEESGYFEGDDLDKRRRGINLEDMRLMIRCGGRGECTYLT